MASPHDPAFEAQVYLAFKDILTGSKARLRGIKAVQPIITQHKKRNSIHYLIQTTSKEMVCQSLCRMLNEYVFESEEKARLRFANNPQTAAVVATLPVLEPPPASELTVLPAPNSMSTVVVKSESSDVEAKQEEPESDPVEESQGKLVTPSNRRNKPTDAEPIASSGSDGEALDQQEMETNTPAYYESKYPAETSQLQVSLPFHIQNLVLSRVQAILEYACFHFAKERMPEILQSRQWRCSKAGELNLWVGEFRKRMEAFKNNLNNPEEHDISAYFYMATRMRHMAVHREVVETPFLETLMENALAFCKVLGNAQALAQIESIWNCTKVQIRELESIRYDIVLGLESSLDDIATRRAELDLLEEVSIAKAHGRLDSHHDLACQALEEVLLDRHMVSFAAGKMEIEKEQDEAADDEAASDDAQLSEESEAQPPEEIEGEQEQLPSGVLHTLQQHIKSSALLVQKMLGRLGSSMACLDSMPSRYLLLLPLLYCTAVAYFLESGGMANVWGVLFWSDW
ncbi:hypothetical protein ACHAPT_003956 [Fusarium lateritium]